MKSRHFNIFQYVFVLSDNQMVSEVSIPAIIRVLQYTVGSSYSICILRKYRYKNLFYIIEGNIQKL